MHDYRRQRKVAQITPGTTIDCQVLQEHIWKTNLVEVFFYPQAESEQTLYWHHHILELAHYFTPLNTCNTRLFRHVYTLLTVQEAPQSFWQSGILRLFSLLGHHVPRQALHYIESFEQTCKTYWLQEQKEGKDAVRVACRTQMSTDDRKKIDTWIVSFLKEHPACHIFKTTAFLKTLYPESGATL